jgi:subtilisin family serine protease
MAVGLLLGAVTATVAGSPAAAAPAEGTVLGTGASGAIGGRYLVVLTPQAAATGTGTVAHRLTGRYGGTVRREYDTALGGFTASMSRATARRLAANPDVAVVEQDRAVRLTGAQPPWGVDRIDQVTPTPLSRSFRASTTASNVTVYVLDTGVRMRHAEFGGRVTSGYDFIDGDANAADCNGHGTHVAGTIAGATMGMARAARVVAVRVLDCAGSGTLSSVIAGIEWVTSHARRPAVANLSLGTSASAILDRAVTASVAAGVTYTVAAGNAAGNACAMSPARVCVALTAAASDRSDTRAGFSNYGPCVDLFAPGVGILSAGIGSDTATRTADCTSMASPHVAGAVAIYLAAHPGARPADVHAAIVGQSLPGVVHDAGRGTPNRLVHIGTAPARAGTAAPTPRAATGGQTRAPAPVPCNVGWNASDRRIPDRGTVTGTITISGCPGRASRSVALTVVIVHPRRGDLSIQLVAPDGSRRAVRVARRSDRGANLTTTYRIDLSARNRNGTWRLRVHDGRRGAHGYLDAWSVVL